MGNNRERSESHISACKFDALSTLHKAFQGYYSNTVEPVLTVIRKCILYYDNIVK